MDEDLRPLAPPPPLVEPTPTSSRRPERATSSPIITELPPERSLGGIWLPVVAMLILAAFFFWRSRPVSYGEGAVAPRDPIQVRIRLRTGDEGHRIAWLQRYLK